LAPRQGESRLCWQQTWSEKHSRQESSAEKNSAWGEQPMMSMDYVQVLAAVVCFLVLVVAFKHVDLQIRINNILDLQLKANKEKEAESIEKKSDPPAADEKPCE
jgi:hypothetical protein